MSDFARRPRHDRHEDGFMAIEQIALFRQAASLMERARRAVEVSHVLVASSADAKARRRAQRSTSFSELATGVSPLLDNDSQCVEGVRIVFRASNRVSQEWGLTPLQLQTALQMALNSLTSEERAALLFDYLQDLKTRHADN